MSSPFPHGTFNLSCRYYFPIHSRLRMPALSSSCVLGVDSLMQAPSLQQPKEKEDLVRCLLPQPGSSPSPAFTGTKVNTLLDYHSSKNRRSATNSLTIIFIRFLGFSEDQF